MSKKGFVKPIILKNSGWGGDGSDTGGGSGGTSPNLTLVDYFEWLEMYGDDFDNDGDIDGQDYVKWWNDNGFDPVDEDEWQLWGYDIPYPWSNP